MDVVVVCHTEFGYVKNKSVIYDKNRLESVAQASTNLIKIADRYDVKITFALMPEVVMSVKQDIHHEIGLHIHPGWETKDCEGVQFQIGDSFLHEHRTYSSKSSVLKDYPYSEQLDMILAGRDFFRDRFDRDPTTFVAGRWSINNDTVKGLIKAGFTHDCSATPHPTICHYDWSRLPRISMPYNPSESDYQSKGDLPLLEIPISQLPWASATMDIAPYIGLSWLKACFLEYYYQKLPLFHLCFHSPIATDAYFLNLIGRFFKFMSKYPVTFKFASEVHKYDNDVVPRTLLSLYIRHLNAQACKTYFNLTLKKHDL